MFKNGPNPNAANSHRNENKPCAAFPQGLVNMADEKSYQSPSHEAQRWEHTSVKAQSDSCGSKAPVPDGVPLLAGF